MDTKNWSQGLPFPNEIVVLILKESGCGKNCSLYYLFVFSNTQISGLAKENFLDEVADNSLIEDVYDNEIIHTLPNGLEHGYYRKSNKIGNILEEGYYRFGKLHGVITTYKDNGSKHTEQTYVNGIKHGIHTSWHNKKIIVFNFDCGILSGPAKAIHSNGNLAAEGQFENFQEVGEWSYWNLLGDRINVPAGTRGFGLI